MRSEGNMSLKNPVTPLGIDPGTVRLVAQRLNHYTTPGPLTLVHFVIYITSNFKTIMSSGDADKLVLAMMISIREHYLSED